MRLSIVALALLVATTASCKKKEEAQPAPILIASAPGPVAVASEAPPSPAGSAPAVDPAAPTPPPSAPVPTQPQKRESIDACCAALSAYRSSGRPKSIKDKAANAARVCGAVAPLVRDGKTSRQQGLNQVRAALQGAEGPPECR